MNKFIAQVNNMQVETELDDKVNDDSNKRLKCDIHLYSVASRICSLSGVEHHRQGGRSV